MKYLLSCILSFTIVCISVQGQVTIGSASVPVEGAILQLKNVEETEVGGANADKGIGMPRVQLISPTELYPMFTETDVEYNSEEKKESQKEAHIGMLVYVPKVWSDNYCPGLYVWNGSKWEPFQRRITSDQFTFTDGEGNTYTYAQFGSLYWTTQNIRTTTVHGEGTSALANESTQWKAGEMTQKKLLINWGLTHDSDLQSAFLFETKQNLIDYGMHAYIMNGDKMDISLDDFATKFGVLYNYSQALKACPTGWRLPNKEEFMEMYSEIQRLTGLSADLAGRAMKNDQSVYETLSDGVQSNWDGVDICSSEVVNTGFNALPSGAGTGESTGAGALTFGSSAYWWFDNLQGVDYTKRYERYALRNNRTILSEKGTNMVPYNPHLAMCYSVRCVKDVK